MSCGLTLYPRGEPCCAGGTRWRPRTNWGAFQASDPLLWVPRSFSEGAGTLNLIQMRTVTSSSLPPSSVASLVTPGPLPKPRPLAWREGAPWLQHTSPHYLLFAGTWAPPDRTGSPDPLDTVFESTAFSGCSHSTQHLYPLVRNAVCLVQLSTVRSAKLRSWSAHGAHTTHGQRGVTLRTPPLNPNSLTSCSEHSSGVQSASH